jgi:hypothetical protein
MPSSARPSRRICEKPRFLVCERERERELVAIMSHDGVKGLTQYACGYRQTSTTNSVPYTRVLRDTTEIDTQ